MEQGWCLSLVVAAVGEHRRSCSHVLKKEHAVKKTQLHHLSHPCNENNRSETIMMTSINKKIKNKLFFRTENCFFCCACEKTREEGDSQTVTLSPLSGDGTLMISLYLLASVLVCHF